MQMSKSSQSTTRNQPAALNGNLDKRLLAYIAAASAAGVSVLALAPQANAKVVFTKTNETIEWGKTKLDLDNDGTPEFMFRSIGNFHGGSDDVLAFKSNHVLLVGGAAAALQADVRVGIGDKFAHGGVMYGTFINSESTNRFGYWRNVENRFLGLEFKLSDGIHFGWARLTNVPGSTTLTGYAYETIPEKAIITGKLEDDDAQVVPQSNPALGSSFLSEQPTLGLLAVGAPTLAIWRREEDPAAISVACNEIDA